MGSPDKGIPQDLLGKAECVIVIPDMKKAAFVVGGEYGKGFATCRDASHSGWTGPAAMDWKAGASDSRSGAKRPT